MRVYYNEFDKKKCAALKALMEDGHISKGDIDDRSITEVSPDDVRGYDRAHFFAGIGCWDYALQLALWPDDRRVWTGSCPCQPFSSAGNKEAQSDERHLWPYWARLIGKSKPPEIFGEQVDDAVALGWLDDAFHDLEAENYACASAVLPACSVKAPHPRDRLWFVAYAEGTRKRREIGNIRQEDGRSLGPLFQQSDRTSESVMADPYSSRERGMPDEEANTQGENRQANHVVYASEISEYEWLAGPDGKFRAVEPGIRLLVDGYPERMGLLHSAGDAIHPQVAAEFIKAYRECVA